LAEVAEAVGVVAEVEVAEADLEVLVVVALEEGVAVGVGKLSVH
jgi:hypothetical protein